MSHHYIHPINSCIVRQANPYKCVGNSKRGREASPQMYVVNDLKTNLLGLPAITALLLAARIESISTPVKASTISTPVNTSTTAENFKKKFPKAFQGLGNLVTWARSMISSSSLATGPMPFSLRVRCHYHSIPR